MILVTLGTHTKPMDRVVDTLDRMLGEGLIDEEVIITAAAIGRMPRFARVEAVVSFDQLSRWATDARAMITHGGPASIMLALAHGHAPIVVPRDPSLDEHVDDHQIRFARWLASRRPITVVEDMDQLGPALLTALATGVATKVEAPVPEQAIDYLRSLVAREP